jgi:molecular chaperone Hsp33
VSTLALDERSRDALWPFVFEHSGVRGAWVTLDQTRNDLLACHRYPPALATALIELAAAATLLAASLKLDGSLTVQLSGDGPVRLLVVECHGALRLRATAQWDAARVAALVPDASLADLAGGATRGRLAITLDPHGSGVLYQGIVSLDTASVAASIEHYVATSEQLQSRLWLDSAGDAVHGLMLQRLPGSSARDDSTWTRVVGDAESAMHAAITQPSAARTLRTLFPHDDVRVFDARPVTFGCKCSVDRVENALRIAGPAEVEAALAELGRVDVTCEFCNRRYSFGASDARALFMTSPDGRAAAIRPA